jgi:DNA-3-methyladenine glycosylase I
MSEEEIQQALNNAAIVRHKGKVRSTVQNAQVVLDIQEEFGSFDAYIWSFFPDGPRKIVHDSLSDFPAQTDESKKLSKDLKKRGCNFVGPTIMYSFMQAVGIVDEHEKDCWRA